MAVQLEFALNCNQSSWPLMAYVSHPASAPLSQQDRQQVAHVVEVHQCHVGAQYYMMQPIPC